MKSTDRKRLEVVVFLSVAVSVPLAGYWVAAGKPPEESRPLARTPRLENRALALDTLFEDLDDPNWTVRWNAVNELGKLGNPKAVPALVLRALHDDNNHPRWRSLWALKAVDPRGAHVLPLLREALRNADAKVARNAAVGLAFFRDPKGRVELLRGLEDPDSFRRWEAIFSLRKIGNQQVAREIARLLDEEVEPEERVRGEVALALGFMHGQDVVRPLVGALTTDPSPQVRWRSAITLGKVGTVSIVDDLEQALAAEQHPQVQAQVQAALRKVRLRSGIRGRLTLPATDIHQAGGGSDVLARR